MSEMKNPTKSEKLNELANQGYNIGQFVSVKHSDIDNPEFIRIKDYTEKDVDARAAIKVLLKRAGSKKVNVRSFGDVITKGNRFEMGLTDLDEILQIIKENAENKLHSIINENIDPCDGGVSGVLLGNIIEFAPNDTPRCVDKPDVCTLPRKVGIDLLETVYNLNINDTLNTPHNKRVEFTINPNREGLYDRHVLFWEVEDIKSNHIPKISLDNKFSEHIGNKVYGLIIADILGLKVPYSVVTCRNVAPFSFGQFTGNNEVWTRTAPKTKMGGLYTTVKGHTDPFELLSKEDPTDKQIASVISQNAVDAKYSGAAFVREDPKDNIIEGTSQSGDDFMIGEAKAEKLPEEIILKIEKVNRKINDLLPQLGEISYEWVYDGLNVWIVQLNALENASNKKNVIVDGNVQDCKYFYVSKGLEALRNLIKEIDRETTGIILIGNVGITSHYGDILRNNNIVSFIKEVK